MFTSERVEESERAEWGSHYIQALACGMWSENFWAHRVFIPLSSTIRNGLQRVVHLPSRPLESQACSGKEVGRHGLLPTNGIKGSIMSAINQRSGLKNRV